MSEGEFIILNGYPYYINSIGNEYYNSELYVLDILKSQIPSGTTTFNNTLITGKRCIDTKNISGTTSTYYVHKHKTATNSADYILDKAGFESPIFEDERILVFENISGANDVLALPVSVNDLPDLVIEKLLNGPLAYVPVTVAPPETVVPLT